MRCLSLERTCLQEHPSSLTQVSIYDIVGWPSLLNGALVLIDVIIGASILAYRYSGLRYTDFVDLIDSLTSEFTAEVDS